MPPAIATIPCVAEGIYHVGEDFVVGTVESAIALVQDSWVCISGVANGEMRGASRQCLKAAAMLALMVATDGSAALLERFGAALLERSGGREAVEALVRRFWVEERGSWNWAWGDPLKFLTHETEEGLRSTAYIVRSDLDRDVYARVVVDKADGRVNLTDVYIGDMPGNKGNGTKLALAALKDAGQTHPGEITLTNVMNQDTLNALADGTSAAQTKLGRMMANVADGLGGTMTGARVVERSNGTIDIIVTIKYP